MDGLGIRTRADELSNYFDEKNDEQNTLESLFFRAKITNTIMSHYPNLVGPDMIAVGFQFEKMGNIEKAKQFLNPVILDFTSLVHDIAEGLEDSEIGVAEEDIPITESLINALEGLKRLGEEINEDSLKNAKIVLNGVKKVINKT